MSFQSKRHILLCQTQGLVSVDLNCPGVQLRCGAKDQKLWQISLKPEDRKLVVLPNTDQHFVLRINLSPPAGF